MQLPFAVTNTWSSNVHSSLRRMWFEALLPSLPIIALEYILFFYITLKDVQKAKEKEFRKIRDQIQDKIVNLPQTRKDVAVRYLRSVHATVAPDYERYKEEIRMHHRHMQRRGKILIAVVFVSILLSGAIAGKDIIWSSVGLQILVNTLFVGAFQLFFYFQIGKKYNYSG